ARGNLAFVADDPDPIFAAIERHKVSFEYRAKVGDLACCTPTNEEPDNVAIHKASDEADEANFVAAFQLAKTTPTTMAGIVALIDYVEAFNKGQFGGINGDWYSAPWNWPSPCQFDFGGVWDDELGMSYAVLLQVRDALNALAVRS